MAFELNKVVPWGRNMSEYIDMFALKTDDFGKRIISFGDGPASFNAEMKQLNHTVVSLDPVYQYSKNEIYQRILEAREIVLEHLRENKDDFVWDKIGDIDDLENRRMAAMKTFLNDFEKGKAQKRYIAHALPDKTAFHDQSFDIGLSSHFLFLYRELGLDFHIRSISEMLRVCSEVRIFPLVGVEGNNTIFLEDVYQNFQQSHKLEIVKVDYEFQKNSNKMLLINKKGA